MIWGTTDLVCITEIECDWDDERKCNACACHQDPTDTDMMHPSPYMPPSSTGTSTGTSTGGSPP